MLLTLSTTHEPATELGYLLHKNPAKVQTFDLPFGRAQIFYTEAAPSRCTAALLLEIDPIGLVRGRGPAGEGFALQQYVNDRPYTASSFLSVAISQVFGSALGGRCKDRPELAEHSRPGSASARAATRPSRRKAAAGLSFNVPSNAIGPPMSCTHADHIAVRLRRTVEPHLITTNGIGARRVAPDRARRCGHGCRESACRGRSAREIDRQVAGCEARQQSRYSGCRERRLRVQLLEQQAAARSKFGIRCRCGRRAE